MKKLIAILMVLAFALPLVACQPAPAGTATPTPSVTPETSAPATEETEAPIVPPLKAGTYELKHVASGTVVESDKNGKIASGENVMFSQVSVDWLILSKTNKYMLLITNNYIGLVKRSLTCAPRIASCP